MDIQDIDSNNFIEFIFSNEPKSVKSIDLKFENSNIKNLFEDLLDIFTKGMNLKYGKNNKVDLSLLNENNIEQFNKYFNSFGFKLNIHIEPYNFINSSKYEYMKYDKININSNTKLNELKLPFLSNNIVYIISFDFI